MAEKKNQHYVPKCHLRPFTRDRASIQLYNIAADRLINDAPIRGQCARPYYYGKDRVIENSFTEIEGHYASIVEKALNDPRTVTNTELVLLRVFALLQTFRSYAYVEKLIQLGQKRFDDISEASKGRVQPNEFLLNREAAVKEAIVHFARSVPDIADLDCCLVVNTTKAQFITSDDPAIHTNRLFLQKLGIEGTGLACAGTMMFLPLAPTLAFMSFDPNVYYVPGRQGNAVYIDKPAAVHEFNEMQFLNAWENIYLRDRENGEAVRTAFRGVASGRPSEWGKLEYFKQIAESSRTETYEALEKLEMEPGKAFVTKHHFVRVNPTNWTRVLKISIRPRYVDLKAAGGPIRPEHPYLDRLKAPTGKYTVMRPRAS